MSSSCPEPAPATAVRSHGRVARRLIAIVLLGAMACAGDEPLALPGPPTAVDEDPAVAERQPDAAANGAMALTRTAEEASGVAKASEDVEPATPAIPIMTRIARQLIVVRDAPRHDAPIRARIPMTELFHVFALVEGSECAGQGWADLGDGGFACIEASRPAKEGEPRVLPRMRDGDLAPFFYAKVPKGGTAHRWASADAYLAGEPPVATLEPEHDYAFLSRRRFGDELLLFDDRKRVVPEKQVFRYRPSRFEGRDLEQQPVAAERTLAWTVDWPTTPIHDAAKIEAAVVRQAEYHSTLDLMPEPVAPGWYALADGSGHVQSGSVRRFVEPLPMSDIASDEIWIDIELEEQVLTVMRGPTPIFVTLISSGRKAPTPKGIFRIRLKEAIGAMESEEGAEEPYAVEAVPYIQYFQKGFALHAAYWHNRFGVRISHGCVNLSPRDAARVFSLTTPSVRPGWVHGYETEKHPGTVLRIRRGDAPIQDRRKEIEPVHG